MSIVLFGATLGVGAVIAIVVTSILVFTTFVVCMSRIRRCPPDKIMVISGHTKKNKEGLPIPAKCMHGGVAFIVPLIQTYSYMDLTPLSISVDLKQALSRQNIRIDVPSRFTVGISTEPSIMQNAAERLLGLRLSEVQELAKDIIFGQLRLVIATMDIEEINTDRDKFLEAVSRNVEGELKKIGLRLINVNVTDISDESGYIDALGREAAAKAINDAKKSVAEKNRDGSIGQANAQKDQRIEVSLAESRAVEGENNAKVFVAQSEAIRREKEAEALRKAVSAEKIQEAKAMEDAYEAQKVAELARAAREMATKEADIIVATEINKRKIELEAEADAERIRRKARGEADAIYATMEAQARGTMEILSKQAEGLGRIVNAAGGKADEAVRLMIADKLQDLVKLQVEAISNIKIDKVTVWDGGNKSADGKTTTANFLSGMIGSVPPLAEVFNMAGLELPKYLGTKKEQDAPVSEVKAAPEAKAKK